MRIALALTTLLIGFLGTSQTVDLTNGLVLDYPFNGNANDESGNGNDGTVSGAILTTDRFGNSNSAYEFDGTDDYINTSATFDTEYRTLSVWVNPYQIAGSGTGSYCALTQDDNALNYGILRVDINGSELNLWAGGLTDIYSSTSITSNQWYHYVLIRDGVQTKYYIDGTLVYTGVSFANGSTVDPNPELVIGCGRSVLYQWWDGKIDDIKVYDRAINECEVEALYAGNDSLDLISDLELHYPFNNDAEDYSGNGYHGLIDGATPTTDRFGNPNSAYEFDGIDDYIDASATFDTEYRTVSVWVNPYQIAGSGTGSYCALTQDDNALNYGILRVDINGSELNLWAGGLTDIYSSTSIASNQWYHYVLIRDGAQTKYYIDGTLVYTGVSFANGSTIDPNPELVIGCGRSVLYQWWDGKIDDVKIWSRALSDCEVTSLFNLPYENPSNVSLTELNEELDIVIYPNPTRGKLSIINNENSEIQVQLTNTFGQHISLFEMSNGTNNFDLSNFVSGIYFLNFTVEDKQFVRKITLE